MDLNTSMAEGPSSAEEERIGYHTRFPKRGWGFLIPLTLVDDLEVAVRTTIGVVGLAALCLYEDQLVVKDEYPLCFMAMVVVLALSLIPYAGGVLSSGASFLWGAFLGTIAVIVVTKILGDEIEDTLVPFPGPMKCIRPPIFVPSNTTLPANITVPVFNATQIFVDLPGTLGDPSAVGLGFLIAFGTFLFVFLGESKFFILGSCIVYNLYLATWYSATQAPLRPIPGIDIWFRQTRTILLGAGVALAVFLIPLPRILPTFIPQPRFACSVIFLQLGRVSKQLGNNLQDISHLYRFIHSESDTQSSLSRRQTRAIACGRLLLMQAVLDNSLDTLRKLLKLLKLAAQYEPLWFPLPIPHLTTVNRVKESIHSFQALTIYQGAMIRALERYVEASNGEIFPSVPPDLLQLIDEFSVTVQGHLGGFHYQGNPFFCTYDVEEINSNLSQYSERFQEIAKNQLSTHPHANSSGDRKKRLMNAGFHTYFFWSLHGVSDSIKEIERLRKLPPNRALGLFLVLIDWPLHLIGWVVEYILMVAKGLLDVFHMARCKKGARANSFIEKHYARFLGAILVSLAASVAFLFILIDDWRTRLPTATTVIIITIATIDRDQPSSGFRTGILRMAGTTLGVAVAFCVVIFFDKTPLDGPPRLALILSTMIFCLIGRLVMQNPKYLFLAYTFVITVIILFFAISVDFSTFVAFSGLRAVAIGIGITIATVAMVLWPISAKLRLRRRISWVIRSCRDLAMSSLSTEKPLTPKQLSKKIEKIEKLTFKQEIMRQNAELEPDIFSHPFPTEDYLQVARAEKFLIQDCYILAQILCLARKSPFHSLGTESERGVGHVTDIPKGTLEHLRDSFISVERRIKLALADPEHSQMALEQLKEDFLDHLPDPDQLYGEASGPLETILNCALLFGLFNILQDLQKMDYAITSLVARQIAATPPSIPVPPRFCYDRFQRD